tara:strand:+ start:1066 stop:1518 length:453 start_codon:yes stop_codon:yes gene_type:complete
MNLFNNTKKESKNMKKERKINNNAQTITLSLDDFNKGTNNHPCINLEKSLNTNSLFKGLTIKVNDDVTVRITTAEVTEQVWVKVRTSNEDNVLTKKVNVDRKNIFKSLQKSHKNYSEKSYGKCGDIEVTLKNNDEHIQDMKKMNKLSKEF